MFLTSFIFLFFFFNDTATTEIYTLSLHDALPISKGFPAIPRPGPTTSPSRLKRAKRRLAQREACALRTCSRTRSPTDRKSTRLNSSHLVISYAVFCLKKKKHDYGHTHQCATTLAP